MLSETNENNRMKKKLILKIQKLITGKQKQINVKVICIMHPYNVFMFVAFMFLEFLKLEATRRFLGHPYLF